jgi:isoquinoline 1-oxidoreductase beta subunit
MTTHTQLSRRGFLKVTGGATAGLTLGFHVPPMIGGMAAEAAAPGVLNAWVRIAPDDTVTILLSQSEMGQGVYTSLPMILAEELECDWQKVRVEMAPVDEAYQNPVFHLQGTGGSTSVRAFMAPLRTAGAAAREMLKLAAAERWGVPVEECHASGGRVVHGPKGQIASYGELAAVAAALDPPAEPPLKPEHQFRLIGQPVPRLDLPDKVRGSAIFGIDVRLPGMVYATIAQSPVFGGKVRSIANQAEVESRRGVLALVPLDDAVAVVAEHFWQAKTALDALEVAWEEGAGAAVDDAAIMALFRSRIDGEAAVGTERGDVDRALAGAAKVVEAEYALPFLAHATMEPMNATAHVTAERVEIWAPTQGQGPLAGALAQMFQLPAEAIAIHTTFLGGGFGRRFELDFALQAARVSKATGRPVQLIWTREEDMQHDLYRPASLNRIQAGIDDGGRVVAWKHRCVSPSIMSRVFPEFVKDGLDPISLEGVSDKVYGIPNFKVDYVLQNTHVPVGFWRSVGHSFNAFVFEGMLDEVAHAAGRDPYELRRELLAEHPRELALLDLVADKAGWGSQLEPVLGGRRGRGIVLHESFASLVAQVAEVTVRDDGSLTVDRIVCAVDPGLAVNPDTIDAQMRSGIIFGLSAALMQKITIENGRVVEANFDGYPLAALTDVPLIEVHIAPSGDAAGGIGEPATPPVAPALGNAIFAATGKRIRTLPIGELDLTGV